MARKKPKGPPQVTTSDTLADLAPFGAVVQCSEYHWQIRGEVLVDWWPASGKWMRSDTQQVRVGGFMKMLACLREWRAVKALDLLPTDPYETSGPACPYCNARSRLLSGDELYGRHIPAYGARWFWRCTGGCDAHVGCHPGTTDALGGLADKELRTIRSQVHKAFDPIWRSGAMRRNEAYAWLANAMNIPVEACHVGMFDVAQCELALEKVGQWASATSLRMEST